MFHFYHWPLNNAHKNWLKIILLMQKYLKADFIFAQPCLCLSKYPPLHKSPSRWFVFWCKPFQVSKVRKEALSHFLWSRHIRSMNKTREDRRDILTQQGHDTLPSRHSVEQQSLEVAKTRQMVRGWLDNRH